ncbi:uncharacterized protein PHACADRAFT_180798 [Phanerochaete carnosa HHB-10118-sp]|uniref:Conserved oligomeric Golgi complex subunit 8 n=1 Tax=Phanerochaete carnosa (strain HHB-10118-sp) TaxID=650164 RepID=K5VFA4_PHACS|nr:uncharacterized protein PHACADRAFT_180798 [Phanerochaete carnosa HHB-10118-sp]EKM61711.1 hypothetical protein PHACADRAFT_180798 [Phanerochaete carnosa HHB-10118-sp]
MYSAAALDSRIGIVDDDAAPELPSLPDLLATSSSSVVPSSTFAKPEFSAYLSHLTDLPLSEIEAEPTTLSSSSAQLTNALTTLCHTSYPTFLSLHATTSTLSSSLSSLSSSLDGLLSALPALEASARSFAQETREIQKDRRKAGLVLEQHDKLHDVLSLPMLLDSCVRNHNYNEALLLANHAAGLAQRFPANALVQSVKGEGLVFAEGIPHTTARRVVGDFSPAMETAAAFDSRIGIVDDDAAPELPSLPDLLATSSSSAVPSSTFAKPEFSAYLSHLTDLPLSEIEAEPTTLSSSSAQLTNALTTLCHTSYPTFLSLHATTSTLSSSLSSLSSSLDGLLSALPALEASARSFAQETREIQKDRRKAGLVLEQHDKLHDVLSLPMLLDSCVRNHNYNEALLLANHAAGLAQRFPANALVQSVKGECDARVEAMLAQLLGTLREHAKLPALFRAVSFLRKTAVLDERALALAFLAGRVAYLDSALAAAATDRRPAADSTDADAHARWLKRHIDVWREGVHDAVTQYTAIFLERASPPAPSAPAALHTLLRLFAAAHVQALLARLRATLPRVADAALLHALLTQLTYCAASFARVGLDFRALLAPPFVAAVRGTVTRALADAAAAWAARLAFVRGVPPKRPAQLFLLGAAPAAGAATATATAATAGAHPPPVPTPAQRAALQTAPPHVPPPILAAYPPLAAYTNAVLGALNGLRLLAPVALYPALADALARTVAAGGGEALVRYARERAWLGARKGEEDGEGEREREREDAEVLRAVGTVYFEVFVPFVGRALAEGVYGRPVDDAVGELVEGVRKEWDELFAAVTEG